MTCCRGGRAEIMAGRGSFTESFPLFGYDLDDYDELFAEHLELLLNDARRARLVDVGGRAPPADIDGRGVYPRPVQEPLPVWIAVGGTPESVVARRPARAAVDARDHRRHAGALRAARRAATARRRAAAGHERAPVRDQLAHLRRRGLPARGRRLLPATRLDDEPHRPRARLAADGAASSSRRGRGPRGHLLVGSPKRGRREDPARARAVRPRRASSRKISVGTLAHDKVMRAIELFGTKVAPLVREEVARRTPAPSAAA